MTRRGLSFTLFGERMMISTRVARRLFSRHSSTPRWGFGSGQCTNCGGMGPDMNGSVPPVPEGLSSDPNSDLSSPAGSGLGVESGLWRLRALGLPGGQCTRGVVWEAASSA
jgi:hypothetical protein